MALPTVNLIEDNKQISDHRPKSNFARLRRTKLTSSTLDSTELVDLNSTFDPVVDVLLTRLD